MCRALIQYKEQQVNDEVSLYVRYTHTGIIVAVRAKL